ncbi:hypothetical protein EMIT0P2_40222 [Pseudomonas sp. IT-P2]
MQAREATPYLIQVKVDLAELLLSAVSIQYGLIHVLSRNPHRHPQKCSGPLAGRIRQSPS